MFEDPIVAEIHRFREERAAKFNYDIAAMVADLQRQERESGLRFVSYPPRRVDPATGRPIEATEQPAATNGDAE